MQKISNALDNEQVM